MHQAALANLCKSSSIIVAQFLRINNTIKFDHMMNLITWLIQQHVLNNQTPSVLLAI